jgi:phosphinothricin acetyltransferase
MGDATIRTARPDDAPAIASIYNQGIEDRSATFETEPRTVPGIEARLADGVRFPVLVAERDGVVVGWAGLSPYRARGCYAGIAEFSIYLDRATRGRGLGRRLLAALVDAARAHGYWKVVSRVFPQCREPGRVQGVRLPEAGVRETRPSTVSGWTSSSSSG